MSPEQTTTSTQSAIDRRCQRLVRLGERKDVDEGVEPELRAALADEHWRVRSAAARSLVRVGVRTPLSSDTLYALLDVAYGDEITWSWHAATWTLCELARHNTPIRTAMADHPPADWSVNALELCARLPRGTVAPDPFLPALTHPAWQTRAAAARALGAQTRTSDRDRVAEAVSACLSDDDAAVRTAAARGLGQMGGNMALDALIGLSTDPDPAVQAMSLRNLADAVEVSLPELSGGEVLDPVREVLDGALRSEHARVRQAAAALAARLGHHARLVIPQLIDALGDTDRAVADNVGYALVDVATGDPQAGPLLWRAVEHERARVRGRALDLLGHVAPFFPNPHSRPERVTQILLTGLRNSAYESASWLVTQIPLDHAPTLEVIRENLGARAVQARWRALALLNQSDKAARELIPALRRALHDPSSTVRFQATQLVASLGGDARPALPEFIRRAFESSGTISQTVRRSMGAFTEDRRFPDILRDWLGNLGLHTEAGDFLDARVRRPGLPSPVEARLIEAAREHAAWHGRVADIRAQKHERAYSAPPAPDTDAALIEHIAHAIAMASISATIRVAGQRSREEAEELAARREYSWHIGRLLELLNTYQLSD